MKKLDIYIIKRFLSTFFLTLGLILLIVIIFDVSEKIDDFLENDVSLNMIVFDYYLNFIPYFANLFSPLFIFISVVFFTSKMANDTEIIAIFNSGMSFNRLLKPFIIAASILAFISYIFGNFIIPPANKERVEFESNYLKYKKKSNTKNIHLQIEKGQYVFIESFNIKRSTGYKFTLENFKGNKLESKLEGNYIKYDTITNRWSVNRYKIREFHADGQTITKGQTLDTLINLTPADFIKKDNLVEGMNLFELNDYIAEEELKGTEQIVFYKIEKYKRTAFPFAVIILTLIAVAISSKKIRGGVGVHLGLGILIAFTYILFMQISTTFATNSNLTPLLGVWIPNIIFSIIAAVLLRRSAR